jgi:hypothetical protein
MLAFTLVYLVLAYIFMLSDQDRNDVKRYGGIFGRRGKSVGQKLFRFTAS